MADIVQISSATIEGASVIAPVTFEQCVSHKPAAVGQLCSQRVEIESPLRRHRQKTKRHSASLGQALPRREIAVMLEDRKQNLVARLQLFAKAMSHQIDRGGGAVGEDDLLTGARVEETRRLGARLAVGFGSRSRAEMRPFVSVTLLVR